MFTKDLDFNNCPTVYLNTNLETIINHFKTYSIQEIPVIDENGEYVGLVHRDDFKDSSIHFKTLSDCPVSYTRIQVAPNQHIIEVLEVFLSNELEILPVVDFSNKYLGSIDRNQVLKTVFTFLGLDKKGAILTVKAKDNDVYLSQICNIIERNGAQIIGIFSSQNNDLGVDITLKINLYDISSIIQSLERYGYTVETYNGHTEVLSSLIKQRIDNLMNFINM